MSGIFRFIGLFVKTDNNLVLYNSLTGKPFLDSPGAIYKYLLGNKKYSNLKHVWAFEEPDRIDLPGCEKVKQDSFKYFITALRAKYWITNVNIERGLHFKKKNILYLNTWHGVSFNTIGNSVPERKDYNCTNVDFFCYESEYHKKILMRDLIIREEAMLKSGLPRNDELYNVSPESIISLKKTLNLPLDKKIILYAPTWRDSEDMGKDYTLIPPIDFKMWEKNIGKDYIVLLRTHHFTTKLINVTFNDFVRDFTTYPRINDLYKVSDILISDYSACIADFSILERPVICFAYDYDIYKYKRGLYVDLDVVMPNGIMKSEEEVVNHILTIDYNAECEKTKSMIKDKYTNIGSHATEICVNKLFPNYN